MIHPPLCSWERKPMHLIQVLTDKARGTKYIYLKKKKESSEYEEEPGINSFFLVYLEWGGVDSGQGERGVGAGDGEERGNLRKINIIGIFLYKDANGILS